MADVSTGCSQQSSEVNVLNAKLAYDSAAQLQHQSLADNQSDSRAWQAFKLSVAHDAQVVKHLSEVGVLTATQTGETENEQTVSPIRTGTGDVIAGAAGVSADAIAASLGNLATTIAGAVAQAFAALVPVLVTAAGGASTPSQTQAKPTASTPAGG